MKREDAYLSMLDAAAKIQSNIAQILETKALESEKSRAWICKHVHDTSFVQYSEQLKKSLEIHEQMIEVIEGLTKMENGLSKNLEVVLNRDDEQQGGVGGFGDMFGLGGSTS